MKIVCALFLASATNGKDSQIIKWTSFVFRAKTSRAESLQNSVEARMGNRHVLRRVFSKMERRDESENEAGCTQVHFFWDNLLKITFLRLVDEFKRKQTEMESECFHGSGDGQEQKMTLEVEQENVQNLRYSLV